MNELSTEAKALLQEARKAATPDAQSLTDVRAALGAKLAALHASTSQVEGPGSAREQSVEAPGSAREQDIKPPSKAEVGTVSLEGGALAPKLLGLVLAVLGGSLAWWQLRPHEVPVRPPSVETPEPNTEEPSASPAVQPMVEARSSVSDPSIEARLDGELPPAVGAGTTSADGEVEARGSAREQNIETKRARGRGPSAKDSRDSRGSSARQGRLSVRGTAPSSRISASAERAASLVREEEAPPPPSEPRAAPPETTTADALIRETALLRDARRALERRDLGRCLALLDQHAESYPRGLLSEERLALRVSALCAEGRESQARAALEELRSVSPRSPHLIRLAKICTDLAPE